MFTCEHGGNRVPSAYALHFIGCSELLRSHRGFDAGALRLAREAARRFKAPLEAATVTRLLVDLNRSLTNRNVWSAQTRGLSVSRRQRIAQQYYTPYRDRVDACVRQAVASGHRVVHVSVHSFTPSLNGQPRVADIGLLYDPGRPGETALAARWQRALRDDIPSLRVRRNYPYAGKNDGLTSSLRTQFSGDDYVGIEIELNQALTRGGLGAWKVIRQSVITTLDSVLQ